MGWVRKGIRKASIPRSAQKRMHRLRLRRNATVGLHPNAFRRAAMLEHLHDLLVAQSTGWSIEERAGVAAADKQRPPPSGSVAGVKGDVD